ncbi:MAG: YgiQ family radical SAM protein, partial [Candidatus Eisenbacteria bacterium]|nr:YgiQ family radical SAM protein [Candidatus Eisenbacteria bacterium]
MNHKPPIESPPLPMTRKEIQERGWNDVDIVFITGDAYIDHPSFAMAILGRVLEAEGFRVAILSQPDWHSADDWRRFGRPRLFFAVSAGNMDSMINHYTASRKVRNEDAYSPNGEINRRPDRCTLAYCQRAREAYKGVPVITGGVEASLRRIAHYDYWSDTVRRPILMDCKADLLIYGMGELGIVQAAKRLGAGESITDLRDMRGVAYPLGASADPPQGDDFLELPSYEEVKSNPISFCTMTRIAHRETNPFNARGLIQKCGNNRVVVNPPAFPMRQAEMDHAYDLPYTGKPHPSYGNSKIPAFEVIRDSIQIMRGCFGGCTFCSITAHEGRIIQSRSQKSILKEVLQKTAQRDFKGVISDIGGPTANMYEMRCTEPGIEKICRRLSCLHPTVCKFLGTSHDPLKNLMRETRSVPGIKKVFVASGIRMDLARKDPDYMKDLVSHHVGGYLKVAPEHTDPRVLALM